MARQVLARHNVNLLGSGTTPMLFAAGFGCDQTMWRFVTPAFTERYRVVLFDYLGVGQSDRQAYDHERYDDLGGYAGDVLDICAALDLHDVVFVGHSISGMIGALASLQAPERFARLIMISSSACYLNAPPDYCGGFDRAAIEELLELMERNYAGWSSFLAPLAMKNAGRPELAQELEASFGASDPTILRQFAAVTFLSDNRQILPRVSVPSLLLQCLDDIIVPQAAADYLHRHLRHSSLRQLHAIGHYPHLSNPDEMVGLIQAYLASQQLN